MTKIDIISGFLGSGKTTLIKKLLEEGLDKEKIVLIENEYGEVGIDGGFLKDSGIEITEMNSGCICCTLVGDFVESIKEILNRFAPDRIIIEPSGVGKLSDVMAAVIGMESDYDVKLDSLVTVVNTLKFKKQKSSFGEFFINQVQYATTVILSRSQMATDAQLEACQKMVKEINEKAAVITTPWDNIAGEKILSVMEGRDNLEIKKDAMVAHEHEQHEHHHHEHHHEHHHDHSDVHPLESAGADGDAQGMQSSPASGAPLHAGHHHEHDHHHDHHNHHHDHSDVHPLESAGADGDAQGMQSSLASGAPLHAGHHHEHHHEHSDVHPLESAGADGDAQGMQSSPASGAPLHAGHHHADDIFDTWGIETAHKFDKETIDSALKTFASSESCGNVLRSKGMVEGADGKWIYFDFVDGEFELRDGEPDYTGRLVVIGTDLDEAEIKRVFGI